MEVVPVGLILLIMVAIVSMGEPLCPDVEGQLWTAHAMRDGSRLYRDIVEINPPLWFWMAVPLDAIAETIRARPEPVTVVAMTVLAAASVNASAQLLSVGPARGRILFLTYLVVILMVMTANQLEQREHITLVAAVPYLVLAASRRQSAVVSPVLAVAIGVGAALGFALKPYFLAVPILVELWLIFGLKKSWRLLRPELIALTLTGLGYAGLVLLLTPDFLNLTVLHLLPIYRAAGTTVPGTLIQLPIIWLIMLSGLLARWVRRQAATPLTIAFVMGALGFAIAWAIQHKGWLYQGAPTMGCLALALAAAALETGWPRDRTRLFYPALLTLPLAFPLTPTRAPIPRERALDVPLAGLNRGDTLGWISSEGLTSWPETIGRGIRLSSRYGQYWMLLSLDNNPASPQVQAAIHEAITNTALDYRCLPPKVIIVTRGQTKEPIPASVDPLPLFMANAEFASVMTHYAGFSSSKYYEAFHLAKPLTPRRSDRCRRAG